MSFPVAPNPHWSPQPQRWLVDQERQHADEVLYSFGEYALLTMMWTLEDFENGLTTRCSRCWEARNEIAEVFGQGGEAKCPNCYGTTFEGGIRAQVIRPVLLNDRTSQHNEEKKRGVHDTATGALQTTADIKLRNGDYAFFLDGTRWQIQAVEETLLRHTFGADASYDTTIANAVTNVVKEEIGSVAYIIPPTIEQQKQLLTDPGVHFPTDFSPMEIINGPVFPVRTFQVVPGIDVAPSWTIQATSGDTLVLEVRLLDTETYPDLEDWTWLSQVKTGTGELVGTFTIDASQADESILTLSMTSLQTAQLPRMARYDIQGTSPTDVVKTFQSGYVVTAPDVSG